MKYPINRKAFKQREFKQKEVDPSVFNDSLAQKTEWKQVKFIGPPLKTHKLFQSSPYRIEFIMPLELKIIFSALLTAGAAIIVISLIKYKTLYEIDPISAFYGLILGLGLTALGVYTPYTYSRSVVFDKLQGYFWRGSRKFPPVSAGDYKKKLIRLERIHALQIICKFLSMGDYILYYSYELNLILKDASRVNVVDHPNIEVIREEAEILSKFLNIPVWDAS